MRAGLIRAWPVVSLLLLTTVVALLARAGSPQLERSSMTMLVLLTIVVGIWVFTGSSGVLSFSHAGFVGIGAYTCAIVTVPPMQKAALLPGVPAPIDGWSVGLVPAILIGGGVATAVAGVVALPIARLGGIAAPIATLGALVIINVVLSNWDSVTKGTGTMLGVPLRTTPNVALVVALVTITLAYAYRESPWGLRLRAARDDEPAARAAGIRVMRERWLAFVLGAFAMGAAGALYAMQLGSFQPDNFYFALTFSTLAMLVIGGMRSLAGAVVGTILVQALAEAMRHVEAGFSLGGLKVAERPGLADIVVAAALLLMLLLRPSGLTGGREFRLPRRARGNEFAPVSTTDETKGVKP